MKRYLVEYVHVMGTTYQEWVEAPSEAQAREWVEDNASLEEATHDQGLEIINVQVIESEVIDKQQD